MKHINPETKTFRVFQALQTGAAITPAEANKRFDEFGNEAEVGQNGFASYTAHWSEHPDRDDAWANVERSKIGEERFRL